MSPRRYFSRVSEQYRHKDAAWYLRPFRNFLHHPVYMATHRRSVAGGIWVGLFFAFMPVPGQTLLALLGAVILKVNVAVAALAVFVTNPLTIGPIFYFCYRVGAQLLGIPLVEDPDFELSLVWLQSSLAQIWQPLLLGGMVIGLLTACIGFLAVSLVWRVSTAYRYRKRRIR